VAAPVKDFFLTHKFSNIFSWAALKKRQLEVRAGAGIGWSLLPRTSCWARVLNPSEEHRPKTAEISLSHFP